jgi:hypothetical protein
MSFYLSEEGRVFFRGHPVGGVPGTRAFVLPVGYRPPGSHTFIVPNDLAGYTVIRVDPNGDVIVVRSTAT